MKMSSKKGFGFKSKGFEEYAGALFGDTFGKKKRQARHEKHATENSKSNSPTFDIVIGSSIPSPEVNEKIPQEVTFQSDHDFPKRIHDDSYTDIGDARHNATPLPFDIIVETNNNKQPSSKARETITIDMSPSGEMHVVSATDEMNTPTTARNVFIEIPTSEKRGILKPKTALLNDLSIDNDSDYASLENGDDRKFMKNGGDSVSISGSDLEYFCVDHMKLCSSRCATRVHGNCKEVIRHVRSVASRSSSSSADSWVSSARDGRRSVVSRNAYMFYASNLERMYEYAGTILEEREGLKQGLKGRREDMREDLYGFMEDIITHILTLKKKFLAGLEAHHESRVADVRQQIKRCHKLRHEARLAWQRVQFPSSMDEDSREETVVATRARSEVLQEILLREYNNCETYTYDYRQNSATRKLITLETVGKVLANHFTSELPPFLSNNQESEPGAQTTHEPDKLKFLAILENAGVKTNTDSCFTGCAYATADDVVMADWTNSSVKVFNKFGILQDKLETGHSPWDAAQTTNGQVAVTVPKEQTVYILECSPQLQISSKFNTFCECWGIVNMSGKFAITCDPWSLTPSVRIFSQVGEELCRFQNNSIEKNMFRCPLHIGTDVFGKTIYISDASTNSLIALTQDGDLLFVYEHPELGYPTGVATDRHNHIYVCGRETANIQKLSESGTFLETVARRVSGLDSPRAICFHPHGEHVVITDLGSEHCNGFFNTSFV